MFFGARRQKHYQSGSEANSLDAVSKKIAEDVRKEIKDMKHPTLFSKGKILNDFETIYISFNMLLY